MATWWRREMIRIIHQIGHDEAHFSIGQKQKCVVHTMYGYLMKEAKDQNHSPNRAPWAHFSIGHKQQSVVHTIYIWIFFCWLSSVFSLRQNGFWSTVTVTCVITKSYHDVNPFLFYIIVQFKTIGVTHIVGYLLPVYWPFSMLQKSGYDVILEKKKKNRNNFAPAKCLVVKVLGLAISNLWFVLESGWPDFGSYITLLLSLYIPFYLYYASA